MKMLFLQSGANILSKDGDKQVLKAAISCQLKEPTMIIYFGKKGCTKPIDLFFHHWLHHSNWSTFTSISHQMKLPLKLGAFYFLFFFTQTKANERRGGKYSKDKMITTVYINLIPFSHLNCLLNTSLYLQEMNWGVYSE